MLRLKNIQGFTDVELLDSYKSKGKNEYLGVLFERYSHFVFCVCMKYMKDEEQSRDNTMLIFEKLFDDLKKHEIENFKSWLHSVSRNHCLMQLRKKQPIKIDYDEAKSPELFMEFDTGMHQTEKEAHEEKLIQLEKAMNQLKGDQRLCIELFYLKEKSYKEIVDETGIELKKVKSYIQNGKRNLKNILMQGDALLIVFLTLLN